MESKGKYVWDPEKQAWVRPGEAAPPPPRVRPARPAKEPPKEIPDQDETATPAKPVEALVEPEPLEEAYEEEYEGLGLEYVGAVRRGVALLVDIVVAAVISAIVPLILGQGSWASTITSHVLVVVYFAGMWTWRGQTLGKIITGTKVVAADGSPIDVVRAFLRGTMLMAYYVPMVALGVYTVGAIGVYLFPVVMIAIVLLLVRRSPTKQAPHDRLLGTAVVAAASEGVIEEVYEEEEASE